MGEATNLETFLAGAGIDDDVRELRPDYRALLVATGGLGSGGSDDHSEALLISAEQQAAELVSATPVDQLPHIAAWREAYRAFGAKPQRTRNSLEQLTRRASSGLPRVNRLTDIYNAISVLHQVPLGGEDLDHYSSSPWLRRAGGREDFDTYAEGQAVVENPDLGEVVWGDDTGVTCRRWNWRQCRRTQLTPATTTAVFILDALDPLTDDALWAAAEDLIGHLRLLGPHVRTATRLIGGDHPTLAS